MGDTNLRLIRRFNIFFGRKRVGIMIRYRQPQTGEQLTRTGSMERGEDKVKRIVDVMAVDGLHARALESLVVSLTRYWDPMLSGSRALEGPQY